MGLRLLGGDGALSPWAPAAPPRVFVLTETRGAGPATSARTRAAAAAACGALEFLGFETTDAADGAVDLRVTAGQGPGPRLCVAPASSEEADPKALAARGFTPADFHYMCLKTHPRKPLAFSWEALSAARAELGRLRESSRSLAGVSLEPSSRGVTGYLHRFRESLSADFDFPEALSCVWDGLRPGALSPGSKAALLRAAFPGLGLVTEE
ncbi:MAG: hypothetical protein M0D55_08495 [Elusimicrobiota bacterium]|nr:MAG: hypothetical protein M0D55_08495 [Elusimicrobiota bacterium]